MNNDLVKVHKDFARLNIGMLTEKELELFYFICLNVRNKGSQKVILDFSNIRKSLGNIKKKDLIQYIHNLHKKMGQLSIFYQDNKGYGTIYLFDRIYNNLDNDTLEVSVTNSSLYFFNSAGKYLRFLFSDVRKLKGKYSKILVPYLMDTSNKKEAEFEKERFFNILEVDVKYRNDLSNFNRIILKPAIEELKKVFENLKVEPIKNGKVIIGYKFTWTNDFNFQNKTDDTIEVVENTEKVVNENIGQAEELEQYFVTTFPGVNYTIRHKEVLEKLSQNNSLEYVKQYLKDQWEYSQNDNNILNKPAYFSSLILGEKSVLKDYLPADYEEKKAEERNRNLKGINTITSLKDLAEKDVTDYEVRKNITPEQIEQQVLLKVDVTEEEYNKIKQDWINKQMEETSNNDLRVLESIFNASQSKKYNVIVPKIDENIEQENNKNIELNKIAELEKQLQEMKNKLKEVEDKKEIKIYTVEDIDPKLLVSKSGKKLTGNARQVKIEKILSELNKRGIK